jgi:hypothetical protein
MKILKSSLTSVIKLDISLLSVSNLDKISQYIADMEDCGVFEDSEYPHSQVSNK